MFNRLSSLDAWLDGVCVSGGEPTLSTGLPELCRKIKDAGLLCKLDTNGSRPGVIKALLAADLLDFIAMDVKAPLRAEPYERCAGVKVDLAAIKESMDLIRAAGILHQFRTTYHPSLLSESEVIELAQLFFLEDKPLLQKARPLGALSVNFRCKQEVSLQQYQQVVLTMRQLYKKNKKE